MERLEMLKIRTRYQREEFAVRLAGELKKLDDPRARAIGDCIVHVLGAPIGMVHGAIAKLIRAQPEVAESMGLSVTENSGTRAAEGRS